MLATRRRDHQPGKSHPGDERELEDVHLAASLRRGDGGGHGHDQHRQDVVDGGGAEDRPARGRASRGEGEQHCRCEPARLDNLEVRVLPEPSSLGGAL